MPDIYETKIRILFGLEPRVLGVMKEYSKNGAVVNNVLLDLESPDEVLTVCNACLRWIKDFHPVFGAALDSRMALMEEIESMSGTQDE